MKVIPIALAAHIASPWHQLALLFEVTRVTDAAVFRWTSHQRDITYGGNIFSASPGIDFTGIVTSAGLAVDNLEFRILYDGGVIDRAEVLAGLWDGAQWGASLVNWSAPADGLIPLLAGTFGRITVGGNGGYVVELRSKKQPLQRVIGVQASRTCRYRFGSQAMPDGLCMLDLADYTVTGTLTAVTSNQVFADSARTEADAWFQEGVLTFTSGPNVPYPRRIKRYAADQFTADIAFPFTVEVGHTYSVHAGCTKRFGEDCCDKFGNALNFGGEPHGTGVDKIIAPAEVDS